MTTITETQDCYNIAYNYLKDKYGYKCRYYTEFFTKTLRNANAKQRKELLANATDRDYIHILNPATESQDKNIELLLNQYYYGIAVKTELRNALLIMEII